MSRIFNLITILLFFIFLLEAIIYPGVTQKYLFFSPYTILPLYIILSLVYSFWKKIEIPKKVELINNKFLLPFLIIVFLLSLYIENITYRNFIFSHFHFHFIILVDLVVLSLSIFYLSKTPKNKTQKIFYFIPPIIMAVITLLNKNYSHLLTSFVMEDGLAECLQFLFYLTAAFFFYKSSTKTKSFNKIILSLLCLAFIFVAGEEISWGQRIFNLQTPEALKYANKQQEISVHNLNFIHTYLLHKSYMLIGFLGAFSRLIIKKYFSKSKLLVFTPQTYLSFGFIFTLFYYLMSDLNLAYEITSHSLVPGHKWQELAELFLSFAIAAHAIELFAFFKSSSHRNIVKA